MSSWKRLSILPIIFFSLALAILFIFNLGEDIVFNPPYLLLILNTIFLTGTGIAIAIVSAKSFLKEGSNVMLILGLATTIGGLAALFAGWTAMFSIDYSVAIYNIGIFLSGGLQVLSATIIFGGANPTDSPSRKKTLVLSYSAIIISFTTITALVVFGFSPTFFTASGPTLARQWVISTAIAFFVISSVFFGLKYSQSKSRILYWYWMALVMTALGLFAATIFGTPNAVFNWTARIILYVASFYFLIGLLSAMKAESFEGFETGGISERWADAFRSDSQQFKTLFSKMLNGFSYSRIIVNDSGKPVDFVFLATNEAFERMTGLKSQEVIGKRASEVLPGIENDPADWIGTYGRVALTGQSVNFKNYSVDLEKWYLVSAYSPRKGYFVAIFDDITERKKAEEALSKLNEELEERVRKRTEQVSSERQRLYNVLETLPAYVILLDKDYCVPFANKVFRERFGESHGRRCYDFLFQRESPCENCETYKVLKTNGPHRWEWTGPDGRDYDIYDFPFVESDGSTLILEMGIDITERKQAEKQLRDASLYARSLIEASLDPLVTISVEGKITDVNQATELATGCSREELIGSDFSYYFTDPEKAKIGYKQVFTEGFVRDYPLAIRHKSGKITEVLYNATIYTNEAGEMQGVFAAARDITELKKAEAQAQEAAKKLKDSERLAAIGATAGMVGHDIRNPLQAITGDLYLAKTELAELPDKRSKRKMRWKAWMKFENNIDYINKIVA